MTAVNEAATHRNVTLRDVAGPAGVSVATASKALDGRPKVRAETRARVMRGGM